MGVAPCFFCPVAVITGLFGGLSLRAVLIDLGSEGEVLNCSFGLAPYFPAAMRPGTVGSQKSVLGAAVSGGRARGWSPGVSVAPGLCFLWGRNNYCAYTLSGKLFQMGY